MDITIELTELISFLRAADEAGASIVTLSSNEGLFDQKHHSAGTIVILRPEDVADVLQDDILFCHAGARGAAVKSFSLGNSLLGLTSSYHRRWKRDELAALKFFDAKKFDDISKEIINFVNLSLDRSSSLVEFTVRLSRTAYRKLFFGNENAYADKILDLVSELDVTPFFHPAISRVLG